MAALTITPESSPLRGGMMAVAVLTDGSAMAAPPGNWTVTVDGVPATVVGWALNYGGGPLNSLHFRLPQLSSSGAKAVVLTGNGYTHTGTVNYLSAGATKLYLAHRGNISPAWDLSTVLSTSRPSATQAARGVPPAGDMASGWNSASLILSPGRRAGTWDGGRQYTTSAALLALIGLFPSPPLYGVRTIDAGSWKFAACGTNYTAAHPEQRYDRLALYVWRSGTKVGTIFDNTADNSNPLCGALTGYQYASTPGVSQVFSFTGAAVEGVQDGDQLVLEVWRGNASGGSSATYLVFGGGESDSEPPEPSGTATAATQDASYLMAPVDLWAPVTAVEFDGITAPNVVSIDANTLECDAPPHAGGAVDVHAVFPDGTSLLAPLAYTYDLLAAASGVAPTSTDERGGTNVTITGTNLTGTTSVTFGGVAATNIVVVNSSTVTCTVPAHDVGVVDVTVTTAQYGTATLAGGFTYVEYIPPGPPKVTVIEVADGHFEFTFDRSVALAPGLATTNLGEVVVGQNPTQPTSKKVRVTLDPIVVQQPRPQPVSATAAHQMVRVQFDLPGTLLVSQPESWTIAPLTTAAPVTVLSVWQDSATTVVLQTTEHTDGATYQVQVPAAAVVADTGMASVSGSLSFDGSGVLPTILSAQVRGAVWLDVTFSEPVSDTALDLNLYTVSPELRIIAAVRVDQRTIRMTTEPMEPGAIYTLTVAGVTDLAGNPV